MRSFLYAAAVVALLGMGALNVASPSARAKLFEAVNAFLLKNRPLWEAAGKTLCGQVTPGGTQDHLRPNYAEYLSMIGDKGLQVPAKEIPARP